MPDFAGIYGKSFARREKERPCGEKGRVSDRESEPLGRREYGGWLYVYSLNGRFRLFKTDLEKPVAFQQFHFRCWTLELQHSLPTIRVG